jgi:hypothetical protein
MTTADYTDETEQGVSVLSWLQSIAEQNHATDSDSPTIIPVAWMGRTSTDDQQDPTLSLPRQLENCRAALPAQFVIVTKFYDVEFGRTDLARRGHGSAHEAFNIPIPRDGGIADLLAEASRPDRRFVAVICESIERVARVSYFSTKIEYDLGKAGVDLLAADEGIDPARVLPHQGGTRPIQATHILTRRIKQAISEWYVINMLEMSWDGTREHTRQGWNIGKPPYGYLAERHPHPVKAKRDEGKVKTRLIPDPARGPVVTQIFQWRALERLGAPDIAHRLNDDLDRYPPPQPIPGRGRRAVGAWTKNAVLEVLSNPKYTGYMVWNRRRQPRPDREIRGRLNPPAEWVWSPQPTHEPLVTRALFDAATPVTRIRARSRTTPGINSHPAARRSYLLRSYLTCEQCGRRMYGRSRAGKTRDYVYYACIVNHAQHQQQPWFADHPSTLTIREHLILPVVGRFFAEHVLGEDRIRQLAPAPTAPARPTSDDGERRALRVQLAKLERAQHNFLAQLEAFEPTGDDEADAEWRSHLQKRFTTTIMERRRTTAQIAALGAQASPTSASNHEHAALMDLLPVTSQDLTQLPEDVQRQLYDAFHLQIRYHHGQRRVTIRITINAATVHALADSVATAVGAATPRPHPAGACADLARTPGGTRTRTRTSGLRLAGSITRREIDAVATRLGFSTGDRGLVRDLAAVAIARIAWRDSPVEDWHAGPDSRITDAEMMRATANITRRIRELLDSHADEGRLHRREVNAIADHLDSRSASVEVAPPFYGIAALLGRFDLELPDGRTLRHVAPDAGQLTALRDHAYSLAAQWTHLADRLDTDTVLAMLAVYATVSCPRWWLGPDWPHLVAAFVSRLHDPGDGATTAEPLIPLRPALATHLDHLQAVLLAGPDLLDTDTAEYCLRRGIGHLLPHHYHRPPRPRHLLPATIRTALEPPPSTFPLQR